MTIHLFATVRCSTSCVFIKLLLSFFARSLLLSLLFMFPFSFFVLHKMWFSCSLLFFASFSRVSLAFLIWNRARTHTHGTDSYEIYRKTKKCMKSSPFYTFEIHSTMYSNTKCCICIKIYTPWFGCRQHCSTLSTIHTYKYRTRDKSSYTHTQTHNINIKIYY